MGTPSHSRYTLRFTEERVHKSAPVPGLLSARLWHSAQRQREHALLHEAPRVLAEHWADDGAYSFTMQRCKHGHPWGQSLADWLPEVVRYVDGNLQASTATLVPPDVWAAKLDALVPHCTTRAAVQVHRRLRHRLAGGLLLPVGPCHGDLTTANIVYDDRVLFIDFLDCFVSSPVMDVAKLRQDTRHGWVARWCSQATPDALAAADQVLCARWQDEPWWPAVPVLTALHLLRILPYCRDNSVAEWLEQELPKCIL